MDKLVPDGSQGGRFDYSCDDCVVGTVVLLKLGTQMQIWSLEIFPEYRGLGHGRNLTKACLNLAKHEGCNTVWLRVNHTNILACTLYLSMGFMVVSDRLRDFEMECKV